MTCNETILASTYAGLPSPGTIGAIRLVTDDVRGVWVDTGVQWASLMGERINVKWFGAKGDGATDDTVAVKAALVVAIAKSGCLYFPRGTYIINASSDLENVLNITAASSISIAGDGPTVSRLQFGPNQPTFRYTGIMYQAGAAISIHDIRISGPADASTGGVDNGETNKQTNGVRCTSDANGTITDAYLENVWIDGKFFYGVFTDSGSGGHNTRYHVTISESKVIGYDGCIGFFAPDRDGHYLHIFDSQILGGGLPDTAPGGASGHLIYNHPHINTWIDNTLFDYHGNSGNVTGTGSISTGGHYLVQFNGSPTTKSDYVRITNCIAGSHNGGRGYQTAGNESYTEIVNCRSVESVVGDATQGVFNGSVDVRGPAFIYGCTFHRGSGIGRIAGSVANDRVTVKACFFRNNDTTRQVAVSGNLLSELDVSDCRFLGNLYVDCGDDATEVNVNNNVFDVKTGTNVTYSLLMTPAAGQQVNATNNKFFGAPTSGAISISLLSATAAGVNISDNTFGPSIPATAIVYDGSGASHLISGRNNRFSTGQYVQRSAGAFVHDLDIGRGVRTTAIEAAATITIPDLVNDTVYIGVAATTTIDNLRLGFSGEAGRVSDMVTPRIYLIASTAWALSAGGNIRPLSLAARTVNSVVCLQRDPVNGLWLELGR